MVLDIILTILIGALIGWLAGLIMKVAFGFWLSCLIGIIGSFIGYAIAEALGIYARSGLSIAGILISIAGACLLLFIIKLIFGKRR